jgi:hypothetical protein
LDDLDQEGLKPQRSQRTQRMTIKQKHLPYFMDFVPWWWEKTGNKNHQK